MENGPSVALQFLFSIFDEQKTPRRTYLHILQNWKAWRERTISFFKHDLEELFQVLEEEEIEETLEDEQVV